MDAAIMTPSASPVASESPPAVPRTSTEFLKLVSMASRRPPKSLAALQAREITDRGTDGT
jgi:hypothetical protein